jgi:hypothetical protein
LKRLIEGAKHSEPFSSEIALRKTRGLKIDGHRKVNLPFRIRVMRQEAKTTLSLVGWVQLLLTLCNDGGCDSSLKGKRDSQDKHSPMPSTQTNAPEDNLLCSQGQHERKELSPA